MEKPDSQSFSKARPGKPVASSTKMTAGSATIKSTRRAPQRFPLQAKDPVSSFSIMGKTEGQARQGSLDLRLQLTFARELLPITTSR